MNPFTLKQTIRLIPCFAILVSVLTLVATAAAQQGTSASGRGIPATTIPQNVMLQIVRAEDERRWDKDLIGLMSNSGATIRARAALAAGRIGDPQAVLPLVSLLQSDQQYDVRAMAAFALGEIESADAADALTAELKRTTAPAVKARAVEALGKIVAALPTTEEARKRQLGKEILETLALEDQRMNPNSDTILFGLTAVLRARPDGAGKVVAQFLSHPDSRVRADAGNTLARLKANDGNEQLRKLLMTDPDPIVRANAARVLGATEYKAAFDGLLDRAVVDTDPRVRVSAIRSLATLKNAQATESLVQQGNRLLPPRTGRDVADARPVQINELLEIATALGRIEFNTQSKSVLDFLNALSAVVDQTAPEVEIAKARVAPQLYSISLQQTPGLNTNWQVWSALAQGAAELANVKTGDPMLDASIRNESIRILRQRISPDTQQRNAVRPQVARKDRVYGVITIPVPTLAQPDFMRAYAACKQPDTAERMRARLSAKDVLVRATAAELLGELPPDESNGRALIAALPIALGDRQLNDAALSILDSLAKQKSSATNEAIKSALNSSDSAIRRRAANLLKENGVSDFTARIGRVQTQNTSADYARAISRIGKSVRATVSTSKGAFVVELLPDDAPLNVDNFVQLARRRYFNGITFHRVVPNFVIQGGDPRGDGNGGPGYQIRCEINEVPYERGAVGMALSGKDTGGSQWFVTHSRQPHLDGGYTVFGKVVDGMDVVDRIVRGDLIKSIVIKEGSRVQARGR